MKRGMTREALVRRRGETPPARLAMHPRNCKNTTPTSKDEQLMGKPSWTERLQGTLPEALAREIDIFETQIELRKKGKIEEKLFAETRLRRGVYGQRYDNGQRHDGEKTQTLTFPAGDLTKGPNTYFDAPGMMRIKIPFGKLNAEQLEVLADLAEEYSDHILHIT